MKRWWVKALVAVLLVLALAMLALQLSGSHSKNAVEEYKAQLRAAGEKLDWKEIAPPPIPPDENSADTFYQVTNLMSLRPEDVVATNTPGLMHSVSPGIAIIRWTQPDVRDQYSTNTWEEYQTALVARSGILDLLRKIPERPHLQFDLDYYKSGLPPVVHLISMKRAAQLLSTAAVCDLHDGDTVSAVTNIHTALALVNAWQDEPLLISQLVRIAMAQIAFGAQWELLQATNVTDEQLAILQSDCDRMQFVKPMERAFEGERAFGSTTIQQMRNSSSPSAMLFGGGSSSSSGGPGDWLDDLKDLGVAARTKASETLWRVSWSFADERDSLRGNQVLVEAARQIQTNEFFKDGIATAETQLKALGLDKASGGWIRKKLDDSFRDLLVESVNTVSSTLNKFLIATAARNISITALSLKRYQLRHGKLPSDLNALVPEFVTAVPRDPMDGKPLRYRLNADGTFLLYSIGKDGNDDGGDPSPPVGSRSFQWLNGRDWVWPQPVTQ